MRVGVIDVGTNSVRVLVADVDPAARTLADVDRDLAMTRLGQGVDRSKRIGAEPLRRTVAAIAGYVERCRVLDAEAITIIATSAVRDASNRAEFLNAVRNATDLDADVLSGEREARLGFAGATLAIDSAAPYLVVDVGGGSTELVLGARDVERWISLDIGSVRLSERHIATDPPSADELDAVRADADAHLADAERAIGSAPVGTLIGLAGTITTVAAITLGLDGYDRDAVHHAVLTAQDVARVRAQLASMTSDQRRGLPAMPRGREDVIVAGVVILEQVMARFGCDRCVVSETDILDGAAIDLATSRSS